MTDAESNPAVIGVDVGGTKSLGLVIDHEGQILAEMKWPTRETAAGLIDMLDDMVGELASAVAGQWSIQGVGVGMAGLVDSMGRMRRAPNLVAADEFPIRDLLEPRVGLPVFVDNDANCAARAELAIGAAQGVHDAVLITLGTGIGGAVVVDGKVRRGAAGLAGEPGHMMVDPNGPDCVCGLRGCWERYASGAGLAHLGRQAAEAGRLEAVLDELGGDTQALRGEHITRSARQGDGDAAAVLDTFAWWVAVGIANCAALLDPEIVIVGGGLVRDWDLYGPRVNRDLSKVLLAAAHRPMIRVEPAQAGEAAGALGAAFLARTESGLEPNRLDRTI